MKDLFQDPKLIPIGITLFIGLLLFGCTSVIENETVSGVQVIRETEDAYYIRVYCDTVRAPKDTTIYFEEN